MKYLLFFLSLPILSFSQVDPNIFQKFESKFYEIDGYNINVEVLGEGDPIFFLPGGPGNSHDYMQGNFGQYYKTNTVVFFDFLGRIGRAQSELQSQSNLVCRLLLEKK